jgi:hypothetical protein
MGEHGLQAACQIPLCGIPQKRKPRPQGIQKGHQKEQTRHHADVGGEFSPFALGRKKLNYGGGKRGGEEGEDVRVHNGFKIKRCRCGSIT